MPHDSPWIGGCKQCQSDLRLIVGRQYKRARGAKKSDPKDKGRNRQLNVGGEGRDVGGEPGMWEERELDAGGGAPDVGGEREPDVGGRAPGVGGES